jgi:hypothetical protein
MRPKIPINNDKANGCPPANAIGPISGIIGPWFPGRLERGLTKPTPIMQKRRLGNIISTCADSMATSKVTLTLVSASFKPSAQEIITDNSMAVMPMVPESAEIKSSG